MNNKLSLAFATTLMVIGCYMWFATNVRQETRYIEETKVREEIRLREIESTKGRNATIGGAIGSVVGGGGAALLGGVGIVAAGTGVGLPAGAALIGLAALAGGTAGATVGAATGKSATHEVYTATVPYTVQVPTTVTVVERVYPRHMSVIISFLGLLMVMCVLLGARNGKKGRRAAA